MLLVMDRPRVSSWQLYEVDPPDVVALAVACGLERLPDDALRVLTTIASKHDRRGRLRELDRLGGEVLALVEAARDPAYDEKRFAELAEGAAERIRLAREQARDPRREPEV